MTNMNCKHNPSTRADSLSATAGCPCILMTSDSTSGSSNSRSFDSKYFRCKSAKDASSKVSGKSGCRFAKQSSSGCRSAGQSSSGCRSAMQSSSGCRSAGQSSSGCRSAGQSSSGCRSAMQSRSSSKAHVNFEECRKVPYNRCFDVERLQAQYRTIRERVWQCHATKAYEMWKLADEAKKQKQQKKRGEVEEDSESEDYELESEVFDDSDSDSHVRSKPWKPKGSRTKQKKSGKTINKSTAARKLGLTKAEEFTGTEAQALKKLLKTLDFKTWNPELYFHIRFFSIRNTIKPMTLETKALARSRWHFILRILRTMAKIESALADSSYEKSLSCIAYIDIVEASFNRITWGRDRNLFFDKDAYKVHANTMLSLDAQHTLRDMKPEHRSPEQLHQAVLSLQYVNAFAKLPTHIQHRLVEEAYYLCIGSKRVILRQGHVPQNYYFVLLGQALSKRFLPNGKTETTAILKKGDGFGSVALFNSCRRLVTVISLTPFHVLVVPKDVFITQFIKDVADPHSEAIIFLGKLWFMRSWPIQELIKCPHQCQVEQFRRTEIVEADSARSKWIYVVKRGTCRVYQRVLEPIARKSVYEVPAGCAVTSKSRDQCAGTSRKVSSSSPKNPAMMPESSAWQQRTSVNYHIPVRDRLLSTTKKFDYKLVQSLHYLDVFGLEDIKFNPRHPPPQRHLLLISDDVEFVMLSKGFYQNLAGVQLKQRVYAKVTAPKATYTQVTDEDCCLIRKGGIKQDPDSLLDPIQPAFCIHC